MRDYGFFATVICALSILFPVSVTAVDLTKMVPAETLSTENVNQQAVVRGTIQNIKEPFGPDEPLLLHVGDSNDGKKVIIGYTQDKYQSFHAEKGIPPKGKQIVAQGKVWDYRGTLMIVPNTIADIMIEDYDNTLDEISQSVTNNQQQTSIADTANQPIQNNQSVLTLDDYDSFRSKLGREVTFQGEVTEFVPTWSERAPSIMRFNQGNKQFEAVFWDRENPIDQNLKKEGIKVRVTGEMQNYRGKLQIKVFDLKTIKEVQKKQQITGQ